MIKMPVVKKLLVCAMFYGVVLFAPAPHVCRASSQDLSQAASSPAPPAEAAAPNPVQPEGHKPRLEITWENRLLTLDTTETDIRDVIKAVSEKTGVAIDIYEGVTGKVSLHEEKAPLEKVVDDLLSAIGQRNYLMVFDGGGLTKMSIVPKGSGGGLRDDAKRVKVKGRLREETTFRESGHHYIDLKTGKDVTGNLRTGREIEYYPGEIVVSIGSDPRQVAKEDARISVIIERLEKTHGLSLIKRTSLFNFHVLKFRILNGRDVIDVMYEIAETGGTGRCTVSPNGLGPKSAEIPEEDLNVYRELTNADRGDCESRGLKSYAQCMIDKNSFLKMEYLKEGATLPTKYFEGLFNWGNYEPLLISRAIGMAAAEGAIFLGNGGSTFLYFPDLHGVAGHAAMMKKLGLWPKSWRDEFGTPR